MKPLTKGTETLQGACYGGRIRWARTAPCQITQDSGMGTAQPACSFPDELKLPSAADRVYENLLAVLWCFPKTTRDLT